MWFADTYEQVVSAQDELGELYEVAFFESLTGDADDTLEEMEGLSTTLEAIAEELRNRDQTPEVFTELHSDFGEMVTYLSSAVTLMTQAVMDMNRGNREGFKDKSEQAIAEMELAIEAKARLGELLEDLY
jgi:hypothetical protein